MSLCKAITRAGNPCKSKLAGPSGYCLSHDPDKREQYREAMSRAGKHKPTWLPDEQGGESPLTMEDLVEVVGQTVIEVKTGKIDHNIAKAVGQLCKLQFAILTHCKKRSIRPAMDKSLRGMTDGELKDKLRDLMKAQSLS